MRTSLILPFHFLVDFMKARSRLIFRLLAGTRIASSSAMLELIPGELVLVTGGTGLYGSAIRNVEDMDPKTVVLCVVEGRCVDGGAL